MTKNTLKKQDDLIGDFVKNLLSKRNLSNIDPEVVEQIKIDLQARVEDNINATILQKMPVDKLAEFESLLDSASEEELQEFCHDNIQDLDQVIGVALADFTKAYLK